uniref:Gene, exons 1-2 n=1 Tax=Pseudolycoriella hygida TaxID=35572 RepID=Q27357_9DIPT|nr:ORF [Pseudolycoriella hygida]AAA87329.1 glycine rich protein [Pseudolycoriella hygida]
MQAKSTFLFVLISSMKLASGTPILDGLLKGVLGGGGLPIGGGALGGGGGIPIVGGGKGGNGGSNVNVDGLLHGLNDILAEPLCSVGLGCDNCDGLLEGLQPPLGKTINSLGLGVDCDDDNGKGNQKGKGKGHVGGGGRGGNQVNEDGLLHGLNGILANSCALLDWDATTVKAFWKVYSLH